MGPPVGESSMSAHLEESVEVTMLDGGDGE